VSRGRFPGAQPTDVRTICPRAERRELLAGCAASPHHLQSDATRLTALRRPRSTSDDTDERSSPRIRVNSMARREHPAALRAMGRRHSMAKLYTSPSWSLGSASVPPRSHPCSGSSKLIVLRLGARGRRDQRGADGPITPVGEPQGCSAQESVHGSLGAEALRWTHQSLGGFRP
jgi:hypothetical protein